MVLVGVVEDTQDPEGLGRVRIRIRQLHGDMAVSLLPWAWVGYPGAGAYDTGMELPYPKGASVYVMFEENDTSKPIVLAGCRKRVAATQQYGEAGSEWGPSDNLRASTQGSDRSAESTESDQPQVLLKTPKGATIYAVEEDGAECLRIVDRAGQVLEMRSPISAASNLHNAQQRGLRNAIDGTQLDYITDLSEAASMRMVDLAGNTVEMWSENGAERVTISSPVTQNTFLFDKEGLTLTILGGKDLGGLTLTMSAAGLKLNGKFLVTEEMVEWLINYKTSLTQSSQPGSPSPIFPAALADFISRVSDSINANGVKTQL